MKELIHWVLWLSANVLLAILSYYLGQMHMVLYHGLLACISLFFAFVAKSGAKKPKA